jgi:hypothetical protein
MAGEETDTQKILDALAVFVAGVPPLGYFKLEVDGLRKLAKKSRPKHGLNQTAEVCLIALSAYFEAFCKAQFAAVVNICPQTLQTFVGKRKDAKLNLRNVLEVLGDFENKIGNVLSEDHDFGSAKEINALYFDLLGVTPFGAAEKLKYSRFLADRNLLVHHGGVYTFGYANQRFVTRTAPGLPHWSSLEVTAHSFETWAKFLLEMATKIAGTSKKALQDYARANQIDFGPRQLKSIDFFGD